MQPPVRYHRDALQNFGLHATIVVFDLHSVEILKVAVAMRRWIDLTLCPSVSALR
eukprot:SAG31_NODE_50_length_30520_cov_89.906712_30_plen_55_part_00